METLFSGSFISISWLINYTRDVSILICLIFFIKFIAAKRLPAWWTYSLWLMLLVRMFFPWRIQNQLNMSNLLPVEIDTDILRMMLLGEETVMLDLTATTSSSIAWWQGWDLSLDQTLLFLWVSGAVLLGIHILVKNTRFWIMIKRGARLTEKQTLDLLDLCKDKLNIHRDIDVIITDKVKSPALFGYFHPRLLLPEGILEDLSDSEMTYVFMHELGHLKRHDIAVSCLMTIFQAIHWFNPLVWLAFYQMRIDQESACDSLILSRLRQHQSVEYAKTIVGFLERYCQNRPLPCMAGILESKTQLKRRLTMVIKYKKLSSKMTVMAVALLIITGLVFFTLTGFAEIKSQGEMTEYGQKALVEASEALQANDYAATVKILEDYLSTNPAYKPDMLYSMLAVAYFNQSKFYDAADVFEEAYEIYPDRTDFLTNQTQCIVNYAQENDDKQAFIEGAELFEKCYEITQGEDLDSLRNAALCYYAGENYSEAKRVFLQIYETKSEPDIEILETIYSICKELGQDDEALKYLSKMKELKPEKQEYRVLMLESKRTSSDVDNNAYMFFEVDVPPQVIKSVSPEYPGEAKENNLSGTVTLDYIVTKEGNVEDVYLERRERTVEESIFGKAAMEAIKQYVFEPGIKDGKAVDVFMQTPIHFGTPEITAASSGTSKVEEEEIESYYNAGNAYGLNEIDTPPQVITRVDTQYPLLAKSENIEGSVVLSFIVTKEGIVRDPEVIESNPEGVFDEASLAAIEQYIFKPATKDGEPVDCIIDAPMTFNLR